MINWDERFVGLANYVAEWSKDRSTKVGCVIVDPARDVRAVGYNGFCRGCDDDVECRHERPLKYKWTEHAERNAIYNAARSGVSVSGCTIYLGWFPCADCARAIIQSGISTIVSPEKPDLNDARWGDDFRIVVDMLTECDVSVRYLST